MADEYWKCYKPDCRRKVKEGAAYCCTPCVAADAIGHEIHQHSVGCDERAAERGECDEYEAVTAAAAVIASWSPAMPRMIAAGTGRTG